MYAHHAYNGHTYAATYTEIEFYSGYDSGTGIWVDYYSNAPWDYIANHINWHVRNENIYIHFVEDGVDAVIYDYSLGDNYFTGYMELQDGTWADFRLTKTYSPNLGIRRLVEQGTQRQRAPHPRCQSRGEAATPVHAVTSGA